MTKEELIEENALVAAAREEALREASRECAYACGCQDAVLALIEKEKPMNKLSKVTRVEVIGDSGRILSLWNVKNVSADLQDNEKTLKIFLEGGKQ